jgi:TorA maturation chaperone TorD
MDSLERLLARSAGYGALAVLLRRPDGRTAPGFSRHELERLPEVCFFLNSERNDPLPLSAHRLKKELETASVEEWAKECDRIFGHSAHGAAPPYELEYGEEHSCRQPQELGDIAAFYHAFGLRPAGASHERADHIATECEFMQVLLYKQAELCEAAARRFLAEHLGRWGAAFALRLARVARKGVLEAVACLTLEWLADECERIGVAAGPREMPLHRPVEQAQTACGTCAQGASGLRKGGDLASSV